MSELTFRGRTVVRDRPLIMAIVNRTPDSFYDKGRTFADDHAKDAIASAVAEGADIVDIGGVSARPGPEVTIDEEIRRVVPTIAWARDKFPDLVLSVDTWRPAVADAACEAGADLINDNWAAAEPDILEVAASHGAGYVCCHTDGIAPRTYPTRIDYDDIIAAVIDDTTRLAEAAVRAGVPAEGILLDPTIDFSKNTYHGLDLIRDVAKLTATGWPVLMAVSHKSLVSETLDVAADDRLAGTLAATAIAAHNGAAVFRAHEVRATRHVLEMVATLTGTRQPSRPRVTAPKVKTTHIVS